MLALPLYRVAAAKWPVPIVEQVYPDGQVKLRESLSVSDDDGVVRSRPFNAARIEFDDGTHALGYVVAIRAGDSAPRKPPESAVWRPASRDCELAFRPSSDRVVEWLPCDRLAAFSRPNRMHLIARLRLAFSRAIPDQVRR